MTNTITFRTVMRWPIKRKLVVVGDSACGKVCMTRLLVVYSKGPFRGDYVPIVFESYCAEMEVDGKYLQLSLFDTFGQDDFDQLRPLTYINTHVVFICFAVDSPSSLDSVHEKWNPEVDHFCPGVPIILVCCKKDRRHDPDAIESLAKRGQRPITSEEGMVVAEKIGVKQYMECSAKTGDGIGELFQCAARASLRSHSRSPRSCVVL